MFWLVGCHVSTTDCLQMNSQMLSSPASVCSRRILTIVFLSISSLASLWTLLPAHLPISASASHAAHYMIRLSPSRLPLQTPPTPPVYKRNRGSSMQRQATAQEFNHSLDPLQTLATIDWGEQLLAQQASLLLEEVWEPTLADRLWNSGLSVDEQKQLEAAWCQLAKEGRRIPTRLASPWYSQRWHIIRESIRSWVQTRRVYDPKVLSTLLMTVKAPIDEHYNSLQQAAEKHGSMAKPGMPYKSCAVVGNSGTLLETQLGSRIDAHEAVIRLNNARVAGFERNVGSKTTLSFLNSNVLQACAGQMRCFCQPYGEHVPILVYIAQPTHFTEVTLCSEMRKAPLLVTDPRLDKLSARLAKYYSLKRFVEEEEITGPGPWAAEVVEREWSAARDGPSFHYSSGLEAVLVALGMCREVSLFGFGKGASQHHYHSSRQRRELHLHDYTAEYQLYHHLQHHSINRWTQEGPFKEKRVKRTCRHK